MTRRNHSSLHRCGRGPARGLRLRRSILHAISLNLDAMNESASCRIGSTRYGFATRRPPQMNCSEDPPKVQGVSREPGFVSVRSSNASLYRARNRATAGRCEGFLVRPGPTALEAILKDCGISLSPDQVALLWSYHQLLRSANARLNLTRIHNFENMVLKHYVDSLLILKFIEPASPLIDMGSGPGLPGVPLAIARPEIRMILAEPRGARAEFLNEVRDQLGLANVEVYEHKIGSDYPGTVRSVITRAVGSIPQTLERVAKLPRIKRQDDFHEGSGVRLRDRGGRANATADPSGWPTITPIRFPAHLISAAW